MSHKIVLCPTPHEQLFVKKNKPKQFLYLGDFYGILLRPEALFRALLALQRGKNDLPWENLGMCDRFFWVWIYPGPNPARSREGIFGLFPECSEHSMKICKMLREEKHKISQLNRESEWHCARKPRARVVGERGEALPSFSGCQSMLRGNALSVTQGKEHPALQKHWLRDQNCRSQSRSPGLSG